jgi:peptidoglycan hydrolase-like protein with peptidoglycan-binding domain
MEKTIKKLIWLPGVLKAAGLRVATLDGWETRGAKDLDMGDVHGVICHHTATAERRHNMPTLDTLVSGRSDLPGPLAQLGLGRDGTFYVVAAGRCNHAGAGSWQGLTNGNSDFIGIEAENSGEANDPWPAVQIEAYQHGVAAILRYLKKGHEFCAGHGEYALKKGRKTDPSFHMGDFRDAVANILAGHTPAKQLIPSSEPAPAPGIGVVRPTLRRGQLSKWVVILQEKIGVKADGNFGGKTEAALRAFQRAHQLVPDGIAGPNTWRAIDAAPATNAVV